MHGHMVDLLRYQIKAPIFLEKVLAIEIINPSILEDYFSTGTDPSIFTAIAKVLLDLWKERWIFLALISKTHFLPWSIVSCRLKFRSQFWLFLQMRNPITLRVGSSIISIDTNVTENIIMKVINVLKEKFRTKNGALRNSSINCKFLWRLPDQNYLKPSIT